MGEAKRKRDVTKLKVKTFSGASINKACLCSTMNYRYCPENCKGCPFYKDNFNNYDFYIVCIPKNS